MIHHINYKRLFLLLLTLLFFTGCGTGYGIYHRVKKGETFQMISNAYGVNEKNLAKSNYIADPSSVKEGDAIWIPGAERELSLSAVKSPSGEKSYKTTARRKKTAQSRSSRPVTPPVRGLFQWPLQGKVSSGFGDRNGDIHDGIDISASIGDEIRASADGRVIYSGNDVKSYGHMIIVKHEGRHSTVYAHNKENLVEKGAFVKQGDVIAHVGDSGNSSGSVLHFEIREGKTAVDPVLYLP